MKKIIISLIILIIFLSPATADFATETTKRLILQAGYGDVLDFVVTPIAAQSQSFIIGMPFNIDDTYVQYTGSTPSNSSIFGSGSGRTIAEWNMLFNTPVKVKIDAEPLMSNEMKKEHSSDSNYQLTYSLAFDCVLSFYAGNSLNTSEIFIVYDGNTDSTYIWDSTTKKTVPDAATMNDDKWDGYASFAELFKSYSNYDASAYTGNAQGVVIFGFTEEATNKLNAENSYTYFPEDEYSATVTITLEAVE